MTVTDLTLTRFYILWHIDSLLGNDRETTAIAMQQLRKYATVLESVGSGPRATMEVLLETVFSLRSASRLYDSTECSGVSCLVNE
jgi:hypothetical protein